jgi:hypothetical protein
LLVPRISSTPVAAWSWPTWVVESETCVGRCVHLVEASISFEKIFYRLPFTPLPPLVRRSGPSTSSGHGTRINNHLTISPVLQLSLGERDPRPGKTQPVFFPFVSVVFHFL